MLSPWGHYPLSTASSLLGPSLTSVRLDRLCITWEGFSTFLCGSQRLEKLDLATVRFAGNMTEVSTIRSSVERLEASVSQVMEGAPARPTLFDYLPLLKEWTVPTTKGVDLSDLDALFLRQEINRYCPDLKTVQFDFADGPVVSKLLAQVFTGLDKFTLYHTELTSDILLGTLKHQDTRTLVDLTCRRSMNRMFGYASTMLQLIPRSCRQLQVLSIRGYSLGIEELEEGEWMCKNLKELRLGVRGLTGKSEIDACLMRLQDLKKKRHRQDAIQEDVEGTTIADRVIRRLLPWIA
ncbi:hypothetical protein BGX29_009658 [Mortierella sp. GBA35]|nr:hypothetical protein BGX29_009658 [Mortierella sp. GBA35]